MNHRIVNGDIMRFAAHYRGPKFHAVLCDPPYELGFMGKSWDSRGVSFRAETWSAISSLLLPGAHLLAFGGTRTFHRIAVAIEDAGLEIRDTIGWMYGSGFPKSHNLDDAWQGYGTALKPAWEPVIVARKPLESTVARNCVEHGCGTLNVDGTRVGDEEITYIPGLTKNKNLNDDGWIKIGQSVEHRVSCGRWPANIIHDGSEETAHVLGDAARFFYCAKASSREREEGLDTRNHHPTVKPIALTTYLAKLIMPPSHVESRILVPFSGSGSECIGAALAGLKCVVGVEREAEYAAIARARLEHWTRQEVMA